MRWKSKYYDGERRFVQRFLFLPHKLPLLGQEREETRWLETARILQEYSIVIGKWRDASWALLDE